MREGVNPLMGMFVPRSLYPCIKRTGVGAYRIRPSCERRCTADDGGMFGAVVSCSPVQGL